MSARPPLRVSIGRWLMLALLLAAVGFGLYVWWQPPTSSSPVPVQATPEGPSVRQPMPAGQPAGWRMVFSDDFNTSALDGSRWRAYYGRAGGDPAAWFEPGHVSVSNGQLVISAYRDPATGDRWTSGGISSLPAFSQTYGEFLIRFRFDPGTGIGHTLSLNPASGSWPPEIDFSEDNGSGRSRTLATLHYGSSDHKISKAVPVDLTRWHTLGVQWLPDTLRFTLDGRVWFTIRNSNVPRVPMGIALQTQAWPCTGTWGICPNAGTPAAVRMYVDWVVAYAPAVAP